MPRLPSNPFEVGAGSPFGSWAVAQPDSYRAAASVPDADGKYGADYNPDPFSPPPPAEGYDENGKYLPGYTPPPGPPQPPGDGKGGGGYRPGEEFGPPPQAGGGGSGDWGNYLYNQNPGYGIANFNARHGYDGMSSRGSWNSRQAPALFNDYAQQTATNPNLNFEDYLDKQSGTLDNWYGVSQAGNYAPVRRGR